MEKTSNQAEAMSNLTHNRLVLLLAPNESQISVLAAQISCFGYEVVVLGTPEEAVASIHRASPAVILFYVPAGEEAETCFAEIAMLRAETKGQIPILVIAPENDLNARLQAVRAGAIGFCNFLDDTSNLLDTLDRFSNADRVQPYHILVVEDSLTQASLFAMQLKRAGMETRIVSDPLQIIPHLLDFNPDLILMDLYMPGCTGIEMAQVIRQMEDFVSVPIVFLSAETDKDRQLEALEQGADDFLTKPIKPRHLTSAITIRVERYRRLRALMRFDALTSLVNHSTIKENLARELLRSEREKSPISFAMIDLDHFKEINDQYGYATGDRILRSLAQLLRQRLRRTDIIGRYGGEEFAVILPNTSVDIAAKLLEDLRANFNAILHRSDGVDMAVTFSCGIAGTPLNLDLLDLGATALKALTAAKQAGRNRVVIAEG